MKHQNDINSVPVIHCLSVCVSFCNTDFLLLVVGGASSANYECHYSFAAAAIHCDVIIIIRVCLLPKHCHWIMDLFGFLNYKSTPNCTA